MWHSGANMREVRFGRTFDVIDLDRDGVTTLEDWVEFARYLCSQFDEPIDSPTGTRVLDAVLSWWYTEFGGVDGADDRRLTRSEFAAFYGNVTEAMLRAIIDPYIDAVFALCDGDADGRLSRREFARVLRVHGVLEHEMTFAMRFTFGAGDGISRHLLLELLLQRG
jgi:hypothetical protein